MNNYDPYYQGGDQNSYNPPAQEQRSNKKIWLWILIPLLILIIGVFVFYFINLPTKTISNNDLSQGANVSLQQGKEAKFIFNNESHKIKVNSVGTNFVNLIIQSNPIKVNLKVGEEKKFDLDNDGFYDLQVKLKGISNSIPEIYIKEIHESISASGNNNNNKNNVAGSNKINPDGIILDIILPKNSYEVDEEVSGDYYLKYKGEPFKGAIIYCDNNSCSEKMGMIDDIDFNNPNKTNSLKVALKNTFYYAGIYNYSIYIYNCQDIDDKFNVNNCGQGNWPSNVYIEDILSEVTPLKSKFKTITVTGVNGKYAPECKNDDDCTQTCTHCSSGSYGCIYSSDPLINQKCVECINDFDCKDGYGCVNNSCVVKENLSPEETCSSEGKYLVPEGMLCNGGAVSFHLGIGGGSFSCCSVQPVPVSVTNPTTILDCYDENFSELCSPEDALGFTTQFENRLKSCEVSQGTFALGFEPMMGILRGYEIQGEQNGNCTVKFWFLENNVINSSLLNKNMTCEYNSSQRTIQEVNDCFEGCCSGELVDAIKNLVQS